MQLLDDFNSIREQILNYFGYVEDWVVLPLYDARECYWRVNKTSWIWGYCARDSESEETGVVQYAKTEEALANEDGDSCYENQIYTQRFLPKWVYRGPEYTLIVVDTRTDGNRFLQVFSNDKERPV